MDFSSKYRSYGHYSMEKRRSQFAQLLIFVTFAENPKIQKNALQK